MDNTKTYRGSCHCGRVRFEVDLDLRAGTGKCNCSFCWKARNWSAIVKPEALRTSAEPDALGSYSFGTHSNHHHFCKHCGIRTFSTGYIEQIGGAFASVFLSVLDDLDPAELVTAPVRYSNGRDNDWMHEPPERRHL